MKNKTMIRLRGDRTQKEIAEEMGIPLSTYVMVENGYRFPRKKLQKLFVEFFGVTVDELFFKSTEKQEEIGGFQG